MDKRRTLGNMTEYDRILHKRKLSKIRRAIPENKRKQAIHKFNYMYANTDKARARRELHRKYMEVYNAHPQHIARRKALMGRRYDCPHCDKNIAFSYRNKHWRTKKCIKLKEKRVKEASSIIV